MLAFLSGTLNPESYNSITFFMTLWLEFLKSVSVNSQISSERLVLFAKTYL